MRPWLLLSLAACTVHPPDPALSDLRDHSVNAASATAVDDGDEVLLVLRTEAGASPVGGFHSFSSLNQFLVLGF